MMRWLKRFARLLVLVLVIAGLAAAARRLVMKRRSELGAAPVYGVRPVPVRVVKVVSGDVPVKLSYVAVVEPVQLADVSARLTATIEDVRFDEGDSVKAGEPMVVLDGRDIREAIAAIEAQIAQAEADMAGNEALVASLQRSVAYWDREVGRDSKLAKRGAIPVAQAEGTAEKANEFRGQLEAARKRSVAIQHLIGSLKSRKDEQGTKQGYCTIRSPYDGVVSRRLVDPGDLATPGKVLMIVEDRSKLKLAFDVPQEDLSRVRVGMPIEFRAGHATRQAKISLVYPSLDKARMTRLEAVLDGETGAGLVCGAYVPATVTLAIVRQAALIPAACAVDGPGGKPFAFVVVNGHVDTRALSLLATAGDTVAVKGISPGELVITSTFLGWTRLSKGLPVEVIQ